MYLIGKVYKITSFNKTFDEFTTDFLTSDTFQYITHYLSLSPIFRSLV